MAARRNRINLVTLQREDALILAALAELAMRTLSNPLPDGAEAVRRARAASKRPCGT